MQAQNPELQEQLLKRMYFCCSWIEVTCFCFIAAPLRTREVFAIYEIFRTLQLINASVSSQVFLVVFVLVGIKVQGLQGVLILKQLLEIS